MRIAWERDASWQEWADLSEGCYLLRTNLTEMDPATLWKRYIQLTDAEWAFRISKDELALRPIWHHSERGAQPHPGLLLGLRVVEDAGAMDAARGLGDAPRTLVEEFAKIKSGDVVLPVQSENGLAQRSGCAA